MVWTTLGCGVCDRVGTKSTGCGTGIGDPSTLWIVSETSGLGDHVALGDLVPLALPFAPEIGVGPVGPPPTSGGLNSGHYLVFLACIGRHQESRSLS